MSLSAAVVRELIAAGLSGEALAAACERIEAAAPIAKAVDEQAERRRAADRERKARLRKSAESAEVRRTDDETLPPPVSPLFPSPRPLTQNPPLSPTNTTGDEGASGNAIGGKPEPPPPSPAKPPPAKGSRLPADYHPAQPEIEFCRNLGMTDDRIAECVEEFRDYWAGVPGQRGLKCDWPATFRNSARKFAARQRPRQAYPAGNQRADGGLLGAYQRGAARVRAQNDVSRQRSGVFDRGDGELEMQYGIPAE